VTTATRRAICAEFMAGLSFVGLARKYGLKAYGNGMGTDSIEAIVRRGLQEPKKRRNMTSLSSSS